MEVLFLASLVSDSADLDKSDLVRRWLLPLNHISFAHDLTRGPTIINLYKRSWDSSPSVSPSCLYNSAFDLLREILGIGGTTILVSLGQSLGSVN